VGYIAWNVYNIFLWKPHYKVPLQKLRHKWEDNIKIYSNIDDKMNSKMVEDIKIRKISCEDVNWIEVDAFVLVVSNLWFWYQEMSPSGSVFTVTVQTVSSASGSRLVGKQWALNSEHVSMLLEWTNRHWELWPHDGLESGKCPPSSCEFILNCITSCVSRLVD
jgi:hypothetical protein